jgi:hypothetical protein
MQIEETEKLKQNLIKSRETSSTSKVAFSIDNLQRTNSVPSLYESKEEAKKSFMSPSTFNKLFIFPNYHFNF